MATKKPQMASMAYEDGEGMAETGPSLLSKPEHPYGLCITLTQREMKKLDLDAPDDIGDLLHLAVMARVKRINKSEGGMFSVECQITDAMVLENETEEGEEEEENED